MQQFCRRSLPFFFLSLSAAATAQMSEANYKIHADEVRQEVWGANRPAFSNRVIPAEFENSSAVIVAHHSDIIASGKTKLSGIGLSVAKAYYFTNTVRELVKINDKAALSEYSEFSFQRLSKGMGMLHKTEVTVVGVRIVKPDGKIITVDASEEVLIDDPDKKKKKTKLAISDLQVGDMIDYFIRTEEKVFNTTLDPISFALGDDNPVLSFSVHCEFDNDFAIEYRSLNGAPDFVVKKEKRGGVTMDLEKKNSPALPTDLWMSGMRQIPLVRLHLISVFDMRSNRKLGQQYKNPPPQETINRVKEGIEVTAYNLYRQHGRLPLNGDVNDVIDDYKKKFKPRVSKDSLAVFIYYAARHFALNKVDKEEVVVGLERNYATLNNKPFASVLQKLLERNDIDADFVLVDSRYGPDSKTVMYTTDIDLMLKVRSEHPFYMCAGGVFNLPYEVDPDYEGQTAPTVGVDNYKLDKKKVGTVTLGVSTADKNKHREVIHAAFSDKDMAVLAFDRTVAATGQLRGDLQKHFVPFEQYEAEERRKLGIKETLSQELEKKRRTSAMTVEYENAFKKVKSEQSDNFKAEIKSNFEHDPLELQEFRIVSSGIFHTNPVMSYATRFTLEGLVKKAGNNYIVDAGKLIGSQLEIKKEQRTRTVDIYMPFARTFEYDIDVQIPAGYKPEGLDNLNKSLNNECGSFIATAKIDGNKIVVHVSKEYRHNFEPAAKWPQLLAIIDACQDWTIQKIMLRKG